MRYVCAAAALIASQCAIAATPIDGPYASVFGGISYIPNNISNTTLDLTRTSASYHAGYDVGASIGYKSTPIRYEGELTYINAKADGFLINGIKQTGVSGHNNDVLAMANIYYDMPNFYNYVQPYLGIGIGYAWIKSNLDATGPDYASTFSASNSVFAYQAAGGVIFNFAESYALTLGYRYVATTRAPNLGKMFQANLANLGLVFRFDSGNYA